MNEPATTNKKHVRSIGAIALILAITVISGLFAHYMPTKSNAEDVRIPQAFIINTSADLALFRDNVNNGTSSDIYAYLSTDIVLSGDWTPIGTEGHPFSGTFIGGCHMISGLTITASKNQYAGLFGYVKGGAVENLTVDASISIMGSTHALYSGVIAGRGESAAFLNCTATGAVGLVVSTNNNVYGGGIVGYLSGINSKILNCSSALGSVAAEVGASTNYQAYCGGIVGYNGGGTITNCAATGGIEAESPIDTTYAGGIVGYNMGGKITNCLANAIAGGADSTTGTTYMGGIVGYNDGSSAITNCSASGTAGVEASSAPSIIGGIAGYNHNSATITNSASAIALTTEQHGTYIVGGIVGINSGDITNSGWLSTTASFDVGEGEHGKFAVVSYDAALSNDVVTTCLPNLLASTDLVPKQLVVTVGSTDQYMLKTYPGKLGTQASFDSYVTNSALGIMDTALAEVAVNAASYDHADVTGKAVGGTHATNAMKLCATDFSNIGNPINTPLDLTGDDNIPKLSIGVVEIKVPVTVISVDKKIASTAIGNLVYIVATVTPADATLQRITWSSSNPAVATVSPTTSLSGASVGVKGIAEGRTVITATSDNGGFTASCDVTVTKEGPIVVDDPFSPIKPVLPADKPSGVEATLVKIAVAADKAAILSGTRLLPADLTVNGKGQLIVTDAIASAAVNSAIEGKNLTVVKINNLPIAAASLDILGDTSTYAYEVSGDKLLADSLSELKLVKILPGGKGELFSVATKSADFKDKYVTLLKSRTSTIHTDAIVPTDTYTLVAFVKDGQSFDLDEAANGVVIDPMAVLQAKTQGGGGSSSGGCSTGLAGLMLLAVIPLVLKKKK